MSRIEPKKSASFSHHADETRFFILYTYSKSELIHLLGGEEDGFFERGKEVLVGFGRFHGLQAILGIGTDHGLFFISRFHCDRDLDHIQSDKFLAGDGAEVHARVLDQEIKILQSADHTPHHALLVHGIKDAALDTAKRYLALLGRQHLLMGRRAPAGRERQKKEREAPKFMTSNLQHHVFCSSRKTPLDNLSKNS